MLRVSYYYSFMNTQNRFSFPFPFGVEGTFETFCLRSRGGKPLGLSTGTKNLGKNDPVEK